VHDTLTDKIFKPHPDYRLPLALLLLIMRMVLFYAILAGMLSAGACKNSDSVAVPVGGSVQTEMRNDSAILTGADQTALWLPLLQGKQVALVVNQTSVIGKRHLVDTLLSSGVYISTIFAPEHGFRGTEDAGATILNAKDTATGIPVISLYGAKKKPLPQDLADVDIVIFDIQDIGARFYTYISTLHYVMEACAENKKKLIILDRPNPNGFYVDGPVLEKLYTSFVGMHPVPIVHGMTIGEYGQMVNGEKWLANGVRCDLQVIPCANYDHTSTYELKIPTSPNMRTMQAVYLYPTLCLLEGTNISVGRGTEKPFEYIGSPYLPKTGFSFTPRSGAGSKSPPFMGQVCNGYDLSSWPMDSVRTGRINLELLLQIHHDYIGTQPFFLENNFFNKLAGNSECMMQINAGLSAEEIRLSWQDDLRAFKLIRKKYLLYPDFE
jgi:uncharacterized protein YbbC (DUF1343 family)